MAKTYAPRQKVVSLSEEQWLDIAFALRLVRSINLSQKELADYDDVSKGILSNLSNRYLGIAESIEEQVT